jgi:hypothetical protein
MIEILCTNNFSLSRVFAGVSGGDADGAYSTSMIYSLTQLAKIRLACGVMY